MRLAPIVCFAFALGVLPGGARDASALIIDDFEDGFVSISDFPGGSFPIRTESGLSGVVGGIRESEARAHSGTGGLGSVVRLSLSSGSARSETGSTIISSTTVLRYDGIADGLINGNSGALDLDLTAAGQNRFVLTVSSLTGSLVPVDLWLSDDSTGNIHRIDVTSVGAYEVPFSEFPDVDLTDIKEIRLSTSLGGSETIQFEGFATIPEPSTALLLGGGLLALGAARRGRWSGLALP